MTWTTHSEKALRVFLENMVAEASIAQQHGFLLAPRHIVEASSEMILDIVNRSIPLGKVMDGSDLVLRADGPAVQADLPNLGALNWLSGSAERSIRRLSGAIFELQDRDARRISRGLDLRLTGLAPGSLYLGFAIGSFAPDLLQADDEPVLQRIRNVVRQLPDVTDTIENDSISGFIGEVVPDAAERDASLSMLYKLAPTGKRGISRVDVSSPGHRPAPLTWRERTVLAQALRHPVLANKHHGGFIGEVREIDLDANRLHLRHVPGIGSLRCVLPTLDSRHAKSLIGEFVRVSGDYEVDKNGRPRLILVEEVSPIARAVQGRLIGSDPPI